MICHNNNNPRLPPIQEKEYPSIFNIARAHLSTNEKIILSKGLKFCPTPKATSSIQLESAINELYRKILIVGHYSQEEEESQPPNTNPDTIFQQKHQLPSKWQPHRHQVPPEVLQFADELKHSLQNSPRNLSRKHENLTKRQRFALKKLQKRKDIIIKPADKGAGIVILSPQQYESEANRQLQNNQYYTPATEEELPKIQKEIVKLCNNYVHQGTLPKDSAKHILQNDPRPARFYLLPKIPKNINQPPGRPIMAGNGHPTEKLSEYVDLHLKPHIPEINSYIKDTSHFLEIIKNIERPPGAKIAAFDVTSLYTNIQHDEGAQAVYEFMSNYTDHATALMLKDMTTTILHNNLFEFDGKLYTQSSGTAMGSKFAPNYANIRMDKFERDHLPNAPLQPVLWKRYIDDVFAIFIATDKEIQEFNKWLNTVDPFIKFTYESNNDGIPFLDTFCSVKNSRIVTRPYTKATDTKQYLDPSSCHPRHIVNAIPYSQALRIQRICSERGPREGTGEFKRLFSK